LSERAEPPQSTAQRHGPGEAAPDPRPGDFILTHGDEWTSRLIQWGQALRFQGEDRKYTRWNHTALIVGTDGEIVEALGTGIAERNLSEYAGTEYHLVRIDASPADRAEEAAFARFCLGAQYGYLTVVSIALTLLTGAKLDFGLDGQLICSGLVARALERTAALFTRDPSHMMPADLAKIFAVEPPPPGTPKGVPLRRKRGAR